MGEPSTAEDGAETAARGADRGAVLVPVAALLAALAFLFAPLQKLGIWDPYELDSADLARRVAIWVFKHPTTVAWQAGQRPATADPLWLEGAQNAMPTLSDLKMGELPFTSMALSFRLFGLHEWTGRLPLAVWGLVGAMALYAFVTRMVDRRAGLYAVVALVTMPLYFLHARTMLGDVVTMSALALAVAGLGGAMLDRGALVRAAWAGVGLAGLAAGYLSRGLLLGVAIPALAVGLTAVALHAGARPLPDARRDWAGVAVGVLALGVGLGAAIWGAVVLRRYQIGAPLPRHLGFEVLSHTPPDATFDMTLRDLGHGLFPWSAFLPFAVGRLFRAPVIAGDGPAVDRARERETGMRALLILTMGVAFAAYAFLGPRTGSLPWSAPAVLAAIAALAIRDFERGGPPSRALALGTAVLGYVLAKDLARMPEKALAAFSLDKPPFPKSFEAPGASMMQAAFVIFVGLVGLSWLEEQGAKNEGGLAGWANDRMNGYTDGLRELSVVWGGNLVFVAVVIEAALVGLAAMVFFGRRFGWAPVERLPKMFADSAVNVWWALPLLCFLAPPIYVLVRDAFRAVVALTRVSRALFTVLAAVLAGGVLAFGYYPALAAQLSPKEAFETLSRISQPDQALGLLGVRGRAAAYYGSGSVSTFSEPGRAFTWLAGEETATEKLSGPRRWLLFKADDLPKLNSLYRERVGKNLPVLDGRSSQILLASNYGGGAPNQNPLGALVLDEPPKPSHVVDASFREELTVLGWDVVDANGQVMDSVVPQTAYKIRFFYRVEQPISGTWKAFLHIDGFGRRYNGDHAVLEGRYPMNLWNPGDLIVDELVFQLEPNFLPGDYTVFFGFFSGDTRYAVVHGAAQDNRVVGGPLHVR